ncbi:hypothetical protein C5E16_05605 [Clavibacter michiganensis]|uniref:Leucine rich repeat variant n=1 Tax=Clavibacter michiganensis TaxID=28447 RepID=A0A251XV59_9MICO|nr:hypothetical protein [Clavibacter michiganensis]OUE09406.1 hypothetical protein CMsap09_10720 [Clavibacter michiganensis]PPF69286.1 hypothetical protein C5E16_05605 [Clavibacter michiganensis]
MSCIRFTTAAQLEALHRTAPAVLTAEQAAALHPAPEITPSKIRRLRLLAEHRDPKVRESVASSRHAPLDVQQALAHDPDEGVRSCLARNPTAPASVLTVLVGDTSERVRSWLAVNDATPPAAVTMLECDESPAVRDLLLWRDAHMERPVEPAPAEILAR